MLSPTIFAPFLKKLPTPLYKWLGRKWYDPKWPRHLFIETTSRCNLSCSYCPRPRISRDFPYQLFTKIVDEASLHGHRSFSLHLFGEPLLYPRIIDCVRYLKERGHTIILTTNGVLLWKYWRELSKVDKIIWSYKEKVKVPEELKNWKNFTVRFFENSHGKSENFNVSLEEMKSWPRREVRTYHNYGGKYQPFKSQIKISTEAGKKEKRWPCYHPFLAPAIRVNGDIVICCADPEGKSVIGNINNMTLAEAWKQMEWIRQQHLAGVYRGICEKCDVWKTFPNLW